MNIKLGQYRIFNEAASTLSFSKAASNLYISQSAVSQSISAIEKELETTLFIRQSKSVSLTREGEMLYKHINQALNLITNAENEIINYCDLKKGELVIGASDTLCQYFLPPFLVKYHQRYPNIKMKVLNRTSFQTIELLKSGQIDIGFLNLPIMDESLHIAQCMKVHDIFVSSKRDDRVYKTKEIAEMPLILLEKNSNSRTFVDNHFAKSGLLLDANVELGAHELLIKMAQLDFGVSCVIKEFSKDYLEKGLVYELKIEDPIPERSIGYSYLKRRTLPAPTLKFLELLKE
ncbi:LysR family transcriptional regulator [Sedimentibacter sp. zth1]|uniref:LysR family transcriptional regulator n=1 Tax=Sedimentibacter sp. zth1 TaxID=2816908 RepID=UPI001A92117F|nr:LysR family transcriptional regulator [Sedimentibacter sp. zth1]QSX05391.1 LysR family transcriptional regulator [Sedimentibacter sp. zth1]